MNAHDSNAPTLVLIDSHRHALQLLALLAPCDRTTFVALSDYDDARIDELIATGLVEEQAGQWSPSPAIAEQVETSLAEHPDRRRAILERAIAHYVTLIDDGRETPTEHTYMRHLGALCEMLLQHDPDALQDVVLAVPLHRIQVTDHQHLVRYYRALGAGLRDQFGAALQAFDQLLAEPDLHDTTRGRALNSGATFARHQGDYERALRDYHASQMLWNRLGNQMREGLALMNKGLLHYYLQEYERSELALNASLRLFERVDAVHQQGMAHTNLGLLARDQGRWNDARTHFGAATTIFEREDSGDYLGRVSNNIGEIELLQGNVAQAAVHFQHALERMTSRVYHVDTLVNLGLVAQAQGADTLALDHYRQALTLAEELGRQESTAPILFRIAHALECLHDLDAAADHIAAAIATVERNRAPVRDEGLMVSLMGRSQQMYEAAVLLAVRRGAVADAFGYAERARARVFADLFQRRGTQTDAPLAPAATAQQAQAALLPGTLVAAYFATGIAGPEAALLRALPREATLLRACFALPPRLVLFTITASTLEAHDCAIDPHILQASSPYLADGRRFLPLPVRRRLYRALIGPARNAFLTANEVVIVPHGPLHQLPFAALLDEHDRPLFEQVPCLTYTPSVSVFLSAPGHIAPPPRPCLALGFDAAGDVRLASHRSRSTYHRPPDGRRCVDRDDGHLRPTTGGSARLPLAAPRLSRRVRSGTPVAICACGRSRRATFGG